MSKSTLAGLLIAIATSVSCMTTYDAAGRPVQSVDPGLALAGVAAAGIVGYAIANDDHHHHGGYYGPPRGGYYGPPRGGYYGPRRHYR